MASTVSYILSLVTLIDTPCYGWTRTIQSYVFLRNCAWYTVLITMQCFTMEEQRSKEKFTENSLLSQSLLQWTMEYCKETNVWHLVQVVTCTNKQFKWFCSLKLDTFIRCGTFFFGGGTKNNCQHQSCKGMGRLHSHTKGRDTG